PSRPQRSFGWTDLVAFAALGAVIYGVVTVAGEWTGQLQPVAEIHLQCQYLPLYTLFSLTRGVIAYIISFLFTMGYGYVAAPGLGSYMSLAIEKGDVIAQILGVLAMLAMIVLLDQLVWRPVVAWSQKFSDEDTSAQGVTESWLWERIRRSSLWDGFSRLMNWL